MNYVIAVLPDRLRAEAAYSALEKEGMPMETVNILGTGYKTADDLGFIDPGRRARQRTILMAYWLVPFGFLAGLAFNLSTNFEVFPSLGIWGNRLIGAVFGAIGGAMGSFFVGGGSSMAAEDDGALPYYDRLKQGKYLILVSGPPNLTNQATRILKQLAPEKIQGYIAPAKK